jgi:hypothetical protein
MESITTYEQAIDKALAWSKTAPYTMGKGFTRTYIEAIPRAEMEGMLMYNDPDKGRKMQLPYILSNLSTWRGEEAREAKKILKAQLEKDKV